MPLYVMRCPDLTAALVRAANEDELFEILDQVADPEGCTWAEYEGPLFLEFELAAHVDVECPEPGAKIARELVEAVRKSVSIDWTQKASVRAKIRTKVKKLLRKHGYPPDKRKEAVETVIEQAEEVCRDWALAA
jgi:hypothetical protein